MKASEDPDRPFLTPKIVASNGALGLEEFLAEQLGRLGLKKFAGKNVNEGAIFYLVEMHSDGGGLDELHRRVTFKRAFGKALDQCRTKFRHFNLGDEAVDQCLDFFGVFDRLGMAVVEVNRSYHPPGLVFVVLLA